MAPKKRKSSSTSLLSSSHRKTNKKSSSFSKSKTNFLSQLKSLRSFVSDCGGSFSEQDLSTCLSQCGYNVQRAAECLLTGQFKPTKSAVGNGNKSNEYGKDAAGNILGISPNGNSAVEPYYTQVPRQVLSNSSIIIQNQTAQNQTAVITPSTSSKSMPVTSSTKQSSTSAYSLITAAPKIDSSNNLFSKLPSQPPTSIFPPSLVNMNTMGKISSQMDPISVKKHIKPSSIDSSNKLFIKLPIQQPTSITSPNPVNISTKRKSPSQTDPKQAKKQIKPSTSEFETKPSFTTKLLLCKRWVVAFSTTRKGSIQYHENLHICNNTTNISNQKSSSTASKAKSINISNFSKKKSKIIRFKGDMIEGTLDPNLSSFLSPLLSYQCYTERMVTQPLIHVEAKGLMFDDSIRIGSEIPLEVSIFITQPQFFFSFFDDDGFEMVKPNSWYNQKSSSSTSSGHSKDQCMMKKAAFDLLQWAHYGDVPTFHPPDESEVIKRNGEKNIIEIDEDNIDSIENEAFADIDNEKNLPSWAIDVIDNNVKEHPDNASEKKMQEESDPQDLNSKRIFLRPYQRQALYWMLNRENNANSKLSNEFKEQLELLSDLASEASKGGNIMNKSQTDAENNQQCRNIDVQCEVGPVLVSDELSSKSLTIDGFEDPVCHPLWKKRFVWDVQCSNNKHRGVYSFYVNELLQTALKSTPNPPRECCGGILADSMGLGKTVMLIALMSKDKESMMTKSNNNSTKSTNSQEDNSKINQTSNDFQVGYNDERQCTLVVTPLSLLPQWEQEIETKSSLSCIAYYGDAARKMSQQSDLKNVDVLITTYGMLQSEFRNSEKKGTHFLDLHFRRVILDESHLIKNTSTFVSKACCAINAERRWCVTGTPIINSLHDVFGLLKFLKHEPWSDSSFWKNAITKVMNDANPITSANENKEKQEQLEDGTKVALGRVRRLLSPLLLRRTKESVGDDGKQILTLPPIERKLVRIELAEGERLFYNALLDKSQSVFEGYVTSGTASKSWFAIFSLLNRLRQACDHLSLTVKGDTPISNANKCMKISSNGANNDQGDLNDKFLNDLLQTFHKHQENQEQGMSSEQMMAAKKHSENVALSLTQCMESNSVNLKDECSICLDVPRTSDIAITPCSHIFCHRCLRDALKVQEKKHSKSPFLCPFCTTQIEVSQIIYTNTISKKQEALKNQSELIDNATIARDTLEAALTGNISSKISGILKELDNIWKLEPGGKVIMFSQFLGMLDLIGRELKKRNILSFKLNGKMSLEERRRTLKEFGAQSSDSSTKNGSILLASMKACGVGLNLVCASTVFIVDPWWNDAMEDQCVNRIHRIGQKADMVRMRKFIVTDSVEEKIVEMQERKKGVASEILDNNQNECMSNKSNPTLDDFKAIFGR